MRKVLYPEEYKELIENSEVNKAAAESAYKQYVSENVRNFKIRVKFNNSELTSNDIVSIRINSDLLSGDTFTIGTAVAETLELTIFKNYTQVDKDAPIIPFVSLKTKFDIETTDENGDIAIIPDVEVWQEVCLGVFYINPDGITEDGINTTSIRASSILNHPTYSNNEYSFSETGTFSKNLIQIIEKMNSGTAIPNFTIKNPEDLPDITITNRDNIVGKTYREVINYIATLYGGYARITYDEELDKRYLEFFKMQETDYLYDESSCISFKRGREFLNIWRIECKISEGETIVSGSGDASHSVSIECADMTEERLDEILAEYEYYSYHPTTSKIFGNPALEVGDRITIKGRGTGSAGAEMPLHSITYNITGNGVTMDIKSLFKAKEVTRTVKKTIGGVSEDIQKTKDDLTSLTDDIDKLYDNTTITPEGSEESVSLKDDYLETKQSLGDSITEVSNKQTALEKKLNDHINDSSGGTTTSDEINAKTLNIVGDDSNVQGSLSSESTGHLNIFAQTDLNIKVGTTNYLSCGVDNYTCVTLEAQRFNATDKEILMGTGSIKGHSLNNFTIQYAKFLNCDATGLTSTTSAQTEYTASLIESGTNENITYVNMSYDEGELRWCWKETVFTYPESDVDPETDEWVYTGRNICYIELPIFMAENIQNDYHINVSKMSWGDYRIIEKNPYYFILESQEEDFAFTFEVVAKLNDNQTLNNNAIVANVGIGSSTEEPIIIEEEEN